MTGLEEQVDAGEVAVGREDPFGGGEVDEHVVVRKSAESLGISDPYHCQIYSASGSGGRDLVSDVNTEPFQDVVGNEHLVGILGGKSAVDLDPRDLVVQCDRVAGDGEVKFGSAITPDGRGCAGGTDRGVDTRHRFNDASIVLGDRGPV